jgi:hypothetical protein
MLIAASLMDIPEARTFPACNCITHWQKTINFFCVMFERNDRSWGGFQNIFTIQVFYQFFLEYQKMFGHFFYWSVISLLVFHNMSGSVNQA